MFEGVNYQSPANWFLVAIAILLLCKALAEIDR